MASVSVLRAKHATLLATVVDTVTFSGAAGEVRVTNLNTLTPLYVTVDGTTPTVGGDDCFVVAPGQMKSFGPANVSAPQVKIVASAGALYAVEI